MAKIHVLSAGMLSTIQDLGRFGSLWAGFSPNGAMDTYSAKLANILVGNLQSEGVIEMTMMGMSLAFDCDAMIALCGADMHPEINARPIKMYRAISVKAGDVLKMSMAEKGMRGYLAVGGGFDIEKVQGSVSTSLKCALGGFKGRKLKKDDELLLRRNRDFSNVAEIDLKPENDYKDEIKVRVILGPQEEYFTEKGLETFFKSTYTVTDKSDRMGIRLSGEKIEGRESMDIISDAVVTGSIQITSSFEPIIMMADRQTTGGYAKIGAVITVDLKKIAQARPGTKIRFEKVTQKESIKLMKKEEKKLKKLEYNVFYGK